MAVKTKVTWTIDSSVANKFQETCNQNDSRYNEAIEFLMKLYIEKQGQIVLDDIYAPRFNALVSRTFEKGIDRMAGMISNLNVDILAQQFLTTGVLKKTLLGIEDVVEMYLPNELLNPKRVSIAETYEAIEDANEMLPGARNAAREQIRLDKKERAEAKKKED